MKSMEQKVSDNKQIKTEKKRGRLGGKERKEDAQGKRKTSEQENGEKFSKERIYIFFL